MPSFDFEIKDKFLDRLMIPINDLDGNVVGFTGRIITENPNRPKYLNSPDSNWFKKGNLWFGLNLAKNSIIKHKKVLIVEGNMDVLACHELGFPFAIASQGTSFTSFQIQILARITKTVWLAFDNDNSGRIAADKFFVESSRFGLQVWQVIIHNKYKDLDEFLHSNLTEKEKNIENSLQNSQKTTQKLESNLEKNPTGNSGFQINQESSIKNHKNEIKSITNLQVLPFLDYKLKEIDQKWTLQNSYEQNDTINRFLELTIWLKKLESEQILIKLANQSQFSKKILEEMRNEIITKTNKFANQNSINPEQKIEINKISQKILQKPKKTINKEINISWQKLASLYLVKKLELNLSSKMESIFVLLNNLVADFSEFETLEEYLVINSNLLTFVFENLNKEKFEHIQAKLAIKNFFSNNINLILNDPNLSKHFEIYLKN